MTMNESMRNLEYLFNQAESAAREQSRGSQQLFHEIFYKLMKESVVRFLKASGQPEPGQFLMPEQVQSAFGPKEFPCP